MTERHRRHRPLRFRSFLHLLVEAGRVAGMGSLIGLSGAVLANAFIAAIVWINNTLLNVAGAPVIENPGWTTLATVLVPAAGGVLVAVLYRWLPDGRLQGPADVISLVQSRQGKLSSRPALFTGLASLVSLGSGASVGQYGPLVHLGGVLGSWWSRTFGMDRSLVNTAIAAGVAAAISSSFNAPLAGILFAHEIILRHFSVRAFAPIAVASITGYVGAQAFLSQPLLFEVTYAPEPQLWEYGLFLLLGLLSAFVAVGYMQSILTATRLAQRTRIPVLARLPLAGATLGIVAIWFPEILGIGAETLRRLFTEPELGLDYLSGLLVLKLAATAWCLGMGFSGGVFSPALMIGSLFGLLFAGVANAVPGITPTAFVEYAVCGMMAVTAPVIGAPLTAIVIVFELTGNYQLTVAAMTSVALANLVSSRIFGRSMFDLQLRERGMDLSGGRSKALLSARRIGDLITKEGLTLPQTVSVGQAVATMGEEVTAEASLVSAEGLYQGTLRLQSLISQDRSKPARHYRVRPDIVIHADTSIWKAMQALRHFRGERVPVVDADRKWVGTVSVPDLVRWYLRLLAEIREEEHEGR